jgi:hypothetical protein
VIIHDDLMRRVQWQKTAQDALGRPLTKREMEQAKRWFNMGESVERFVEWLLRKRSPLK